MTAFIIRPVALSDVPAITAIYEHAVLHGTATYELAPPNEGEMRQRLEATVGQGYPYIVAEDRAGAVIGYAYANAFRARPAYRWSVEDSVYLAPAAKGQGVGTALLTRLVEIATESGFRQMVAVIGGSDHAPSIRLHERAGFRKIGIFEKSGFKFGRWIDTVLMQMALGEGGDSLPDEDAFPGTLYRR
ncbi:GNAT family N-acetyltransferase [Aurantimonas sp. VKM B-3413]|uniref:GNAT family N-acetyltransferase n=1 Tax=Aurantimonas sp. VKM B-3413 TaxID=2779401 RepID=UPI001E31C258|nr:GNAT family N-acetyltransferase [Aurantimonas sp. VKM B-3413]MCB8839183.1 N-acetyltransferase family protein [Aurantimonas sp. VKM B-3413]